MCTFFSKNKRDRVATIVPKKEGVDIGQRSLALNLNSSLSSKMLLEYSPHSCKNFTYFLFTRVVFREMLSKTDCMKINSLYGCFNDPAVNRKIQIICAMVGI